MPSWWGKSSSKEVKKKTGKESFIDTLHRKLKNTTESKLNGKSGGSRKHCSDTILEKGSKSRAESRYPSPSKQVSRCQSFAERPLAQPLPLPVVHLATVGCVDAEIGISSKSKLDKTSKSSLFRPLPMPGCIKRTDLDGDFARASVSSESSIDSDDPADSRLRTPQATYSDQVNKTILSSTSTVMLNDHSSAVAQGNSREDKKPSNISFGNLASPKRRPLGTRVPNLQILHHSAICCASDSSMSSPARSPLRVFGSEQVINSAFWAGKPYSDVALRGSGHCSSPGSGYNSGHNSMGGDMPGQLLWQQSRGSPEYSPIPSPRMTSPGPSSRFQSGAVTPVHPRAGGTIIDSQISWPDDGKQQSHRLPLPPVSVSSPPPFSHSNSAATSPSVPKSPGRAENPISPGSCWKKGKLLGRGTFGHVYIGFNSESGEMCAMKEVTLFSDDAKSKECAKQLMQEIALLSHLQHPNIVQYYGSETGGDRLYIYLEYVSGGSIYKLLQDYGQLGELAIRSYTHQILSGLSYLHSKSTIHRDIKGANILVDPNGRVKLADFGMAKHITGQSCPLSFKGSPYWMAPEVIKNSNGCNLAVDIWSLGCTVLEMATTKPPWSQFEGVAAMFKIGNSKDLPAIPDHLSDEGKDFVKRCLQRNPKDRPTAAQLLEHPFVKSAAPLERPFPGLEALDQSPAVMNGVKALGIGQATNFNPLESERFIIHSSIALKTEYHASDIHIPRNISCPVSPIGSPLLNSRSPRMSPSPISSPRTTSGSSTPLTGGSAGAIPFNYWKQVYLQEGFGSMPKSSSGMNVNGFSYHGCSPDLFQVQPGSLIFSELVPGENDALGKQLGRPALRVLDDRRSVLTDRVSQQQLRDHMEMNGSFDLSPKSPLPNWTNGI